MEQNRETVIKCLPYFKIFLNNLNSLKYNINNLIKIRHTCLSIDKAGLLTLAPPPNHPENPNQPNDSETAEREVNDRGVVVGHVVDPMMCEHLASTVYFTLTNLLGLSLSLALSVCVLIKVYYFNRCIHTYITPLYIMYFFIILLFTQCASPLNKVFPRSSRPSPRCCLPWPGSAGRLAQDRGRWR